MNDSDYSSICLVILYFGKLPNYFEFWLNSCRYNRTINFLIFTDDRTSFDFPSNVKVVYLSFETIKKMIQNKFDFKIALDRPYKLCDYKPAYGYLFSDYLSRYDFWGHCDLDTIFGNLRKYLKEDILKKYDKIYRAGHFSLYKNNQFINESFMQFKDDNDFPIYRYVYSSNDSFFFDETGKNNKGILNFYNKNNLSLYSNKMDIADISTKYNNLVILNNKNFNRPSIFFYRNNNQQSELYAYTKIKGKIYIKEYMYIHMQKRKIKIQTRNVDEYIIIPDMFIDNIDINKNYEKLNKKLTLIRKEYLYNKLKNLIKKL